MAELGPVPPSRVSGRTLATSNFRAAYTKAKPPKGPLQLGIILGKLLEGYCRKESIPWDGDAGEEFLERCARSCSYRALDG